MKDTKPFQIIFIAVCMLLTVVGVLAFSFGGTKKNPDENVGPVVVIWGTKEEEMFNDLIRDVNNAGVPINATYVQKDKENFNQILLEALATGKGPDVILTSVEDILTYQDKITMLPFSTLNERTFKDNFIEEGEIFRTDIGFLAVPFSVDPLVLYWNRDIFTVHNKTAPPSNWNAVVSLVPEMRDISEDLAVHEAVISLGDYRNITNAKAILSTLMLQSGTPITSLQYEATRQRLFLSSELEAQNRERLIVPAVAALNFYTQFADPLSKVYSWNRALPASLEMFASDDLAMYIGFGSEAGLIRSKNPNLNFDMALLPQSDSSPVPVTYGKMEGFAILTTSKNKTGSFAAINALTGSVFLKAYALVSGLPPVRRDLLAVPPSDAAGSILYRSALYSRGYFDPNPSKTDTIFQTMVESILSGRSSSNESLRTTNNQFRLLIDEFNKKQEEE